MGPCSRATGAWRAHPRMFFSEERELLVSREEKKYKTGELGSLYPIATSPFNRRSVFTAEP